MRKTSVGIEFHIRIDRLKKNFVCNTVCKPLSHRLLTNVLEERQVLLRYMILESKAP